MPQPSLLSLLDELLDPNALLRVLDDAIGDFAPELVTATPGNTLSSSHQTRMPKKRNYDPNKARSEQLRELQRLRVEATDLTLRLQQLQTRHNRALPLHSEEEDIDLPACEQCEEPQYQDHHDIDEHVVVNVVVSDIKHAVQVGSNGNPAYSVWCILQCLAASRKLRHV
ncbi:hypothetical protein PI125_g3112 [Phytophthora idaei]|nr:hypothetical protein PI125_g3112 [Phytophthora idaei]